MSVLRLSPYLLGKNPSSLSTQHLMSCPTLRMASHLAAAILDLVDG